MVSRMVESTRQVGMLFALLCLVGCGERVNVTEVQLEAEVRYLRDQTRELERVLRELEEAAKEEEVETEKEGKGEVIEEMYSVVFEIQPVDDEVFADAVLNADTEAAIMALRDVAKAEVVAGKFTLRSVDYSGQFSHSSSVRREHPNRFLGIGGEDPEDNPALIPRRLSTSIRPELDVSLEVLGGDKDVLLVSLEIQSDKILEPYKYPLAKVFKDRDPGTLSLPQEHTARLKTSAKVMLGEPTFVGTIDASSEESYGQSLVFLTIRKAEE